jgi:protein TonB
MSALVEKCLSKEPVDRPLDFACIEKEIRQLRRDWTPGSAPIFATADIDPEGVTELFDTGAEPILRASAGAPAKTVVQRGGTAVVSEEPAVSGSSTARSQRGSSPYSQPMANQGRAGGARGALLVGLALVGAVAVALALWWMLAGSGGAASRSAVEGTSLAEHSQDVSTSLPTGQQGMDQPAERPTMGDGGALANQGGVDLVVEGAGVATRSQSGSEDSAASGTASPPAQRPVSSVARDRSQLSKDAPSRSQPAKQPASPTKVPAESSATQSTPSATAGERADAATGSGAQREPPPTQPAQQDAETATKAKAAPGPRVATADPGALPAGRQSGSKSETLSQTSPPAASRVETPAGPIQPGTEDRKPIPIARERPDYPERARRRRVEARVVVAVLVNAEGQVERAILKQRDDSSLGFNEAAIAAAKKTRFQPATRDGVAGAMWTELPFDFRLR